MPASPHHAPAISLRDVTKRFGSTTVVRDVTFDVERGELFSLLGPSGCGKTTLLRLIAGFDDVSSGSVMLGGRDVSADPPYRRDVNTVFQQYALFPHLDVFENVAFGPRARGMADAEVRTRVEEILAVVRMAELARRRPHQLSGGQRQRAALARALVNRPSALLLDEPLGALDLQLRQAMQLELRRIQRETGIAFLFVTHDQEEAMALSDRMAVMNQGCIEQTGTPQEVYDAPATAFAARFLGAANLLPVRVVSGDGTTAIVELEDALTIPVNAAAEAVATEERAQARAQVTALLMVRPERVGIAMTREAVPARHCAAAVTVTDTMFQGAVLRCVTRDRRGREIVAVLGAGGDASKLRRGLAAFAHWHIAAARLLAS